MCCCWPLTGWTLEYSMPFPPSSTQQLLNILITRWKFSLLFSFQKILLKTISSAKFSTCLFNLIIFLRLSDKIICAKCDLLIRLHCTLVHNCTNWTCISYTVREWRRTPGWLASLSWSAGCWAPWSAASYWTELTRTKQQLSLSTSSLSLEWSCILLHSDLAVLVWSTSLRLYLGQ